MYIENPDDYQLSGAWWKFGDQVLTFNLLLLSWATGSVSSGNLSAFDAIGRKVREIAGDDIVFIVVTP